MLFMVLLKADEMKLITGCKCTSQVNAFFLCLYFDWPSSWHLFLHAWQVSAQSQLRHFILASEHLFHA